MKTKILLSIILLAVCYSCESTYLVLGKYDLKGTCFDNVYQRTHPDNRIVTIKQGKKNLLIDIGGVSVFKAYETNDSLFIIPHQVYNGSTERIGFSGEGVIRNDSLFLHYYTGGSFGDLECECKGKKIE